MVKYLSLTEIETVKVRSPKTSSNTLINFVSGENFSWDMDRIWEYLSVMETLDLYEAERGATGDKLQEIYIYSDPAQPRLTDSSQQSSRWKTQNLEIVCVGVGTFQCSTPLLTYHVMVICLSAQC